ncbi:tail fiber domain-containing protein [Salmonella enterica subsp. enterica]
MQSIQFKRTGEAGKVPTPEQLQVGEIALQLTDHVIFTKDKNHKVVQISVSPETHEELESKVDANKKELDQTIALNDETINTKVDEIKTATDATIAANDEAINSKVDTIKRETDATILANKNKASSDLAAAVEELNTTIEINKTAAATATTELDTRINKKVDDIKKRTDATITANDTAINEKVDEIKTTTDRTIAANAEHAQNQLDAVDTRLTGVIEANKEEAAQAVTALSGMVEAKDTAIHAKVDGNKTHADSEIARLDSRIDLIDGSSDGKFIKMNTNTATEGHLLSRTANYLENADLQNIDYLNYFGAYRVNGADNWGNPTGLILNVPHSAGKAHGRGFEFQYGTAGNMVRTYGFDVNGEKIYSHRMYHEGDKPTPAELNVYSKEEVDRMFQKTLWIDAAGGWFKIASFTMGQNWGKELIIRLVGGNGYNKGQTGQTNIHELVIRNSNDNPKGVNFTVFQHMAAYDQNFCVVNTSGDDYEIYAQYFEHTVYVMAQYQASRDVSLVVHDNPERFTEIPTGENVTNAALINMFNSFRNRGTLAFQGNGHNQYDLDHLCEAPNDGKKYIRRFRSSQPATIWHETVAGGDYRLSTGLTDSEEQLYIQATGGNQGGLVTAGRFTAKGGNDGFKIMYDSATESAMYQIYSRLDGSLEAYMGYGDKNQKDFTIHNRLGNMILSTKDGRGLVNVQGGLTVNGNELILYGTDQNNPTASQIRIQNWGSGDRKTVFEIKDDAGYHFYSQRNPNGNVEFQFAGSVTANNGAIIYGGGGVYIRSNENRHIWFQDNAGNEKAVLYAEDNGGVKLRTNNQQRSTHFNDGMIHITGQLTVGSDKGLIRGTPEGGAWAAWRERAAGILIDCPDSRQSAYSIWKATHWGDQHMAAMGIHAGGGNPSVMMHIAGTSFTWDHSGQFHASTNVHCNDVYIRSDRRLKVNIEDYTENATDKVNKLTVKTYDKVKSLSDREVIGHEIGVIAQDLQEVLPEAVTTTKIGDPDNPDEILVVSNSGVNALLIKAIQEMSARIEYLEARVK